MIKCSCCGVTIEYNTSICPICGSSVECQNLPNYYPPIAIAPKISIFNYKVISAFVAFILTIIFSVINYFVAPAIPWSLPIMSIIIAAYVNILMYNINFSLTFRYACCLFAVVLIPIAFGYTLNEMTIVIKYIIPSIFLAFIVTINILYWVIFVLSNRYKRVKHLKCDTNKLMLATLYLSMTGIIPLILFGSSVIVNLAISSATMIIGVTCATLILLINIKNLKHIFSAYYHI